MKLEAGKRYITVSGSVTSKLRVEFGNIYEGKIGGNIYTWYPDGTDTTSRMNNIIQEYNRIPSPQERKESVNDTQHGGTHYKTKPIEPWDYVAANNLGFFEGNAIKYITRHKDKNGIEDLKKAIHYLQKLIELEQQND